MTEPDARSSPPYRAAVLAGLSVLLVYVLTLAPTVTLWDAGEFLAAAKVLGIPHPPGTPLFVVLAHVWGLLLPFGEYAWRLNLLSALFGAGAATCWFLVAHRTLGALEEVPEAWRNHVRLGGAFAAAWLSGFAFTVWQNANETEVYAVSHFVIACVAWLSLRWRASTDPVRRDRLLLAVVYLLGLSLGNHLLGLLAGPGLVLFLIAEARTAADPIARQRVWARTAVIGTIWLLLLGTGLGSTPVLIFGAAAFLAAAALASRYRTLGFAVGSLGVAAVGVTPYLYLYLRTQHHPVINEAAPATFDALVDVIRREQYPPRTPLDDPTLPSGPGNPGRTAGLLTLQVHNYLQYFDWQWARSLPGTLPFGLPLRTLVTLAMLSLGLRGIRAQRAADRTAWWLLGGIWLATGVGLVLYMNFKPGFSLGFGQYPNPGDHEVRERDYFFLVSFAVWGVWAGMGLARLAAGVLTRTRRMVPGMAVLALAAVPLVATGPAASRRHGPDARLAADFAYDLLNSVPPYGILFTYGDNDTFPLWWAQEVEGVRRDVTVVCLALADTPWYLRQIRDLPLRPFDPQAAAPIWRTASPNLPDDPVHRMTDDEINGALFQQLERDTRVDLGPVQITLPKGRVLQGADFAMLLAIQLNYGKRPIAWALGATGELPGIDSAVVQEGLVALLRAERPDTTDPDLAMHPVLGMPLSISRTALLMNEVYRFGDLLRRGVRDVSLDATSQSIATTMGLPFTELGVVMELRADTAQARRYYLRARQFNANPAIDEALRRLGR